MKLVTVSGLLVMLMTLISLPYSTVQANSIRDTGDKYSMNIKISGTIVANGSCTFNQGGTIDVDFGDVRFKTTTTGNTLEGKYIKELASSMTCTGDTEGTASMLLSSDNQQAVDYEGHKLLGTLVNKTSTPDLAIMLQVNDVVQDINNAFTVNMQNPPVLTVELIQVGSGSTMNNDAEITASATLTMAFN